MNVLRVLIVGAGGFGRAVADAMTSGSVAAGFVDDRGPSCGPVMGLPVFGTTADLQTLRQEFDELVVAIGDNRRRRELCEAALALGYRLAPIVHSRSWVSSHARIGPGSIVMAGAIVGTEAVIGSGVIVNAGAIVDHHAVVGDHAHLGIGAGLGGGVRVGDGAWLREGVFLAPGESVDPWRVIERASTTGVPRT